MSPAPAMRACSSSRFFLRWKVSSISSTDVATWRGGRPLPPRPPVMIAGTPASCPDTSSELALIPPPGPAGHGPRQHARKLFTEPVLKASIFPAEERLVKRYDEQP